MGLSVRAKSFKRKFKSQERKREGMRRLSKESNRVVKGGKFQKRIKGSRWGLVFIIYQWREDKQEGVKN